MKDNHLTNQEEKKPVILFSFDGTLFDTEPAVLACYRQVFSMFGKESDFDHEKQIQVLDASVTKMMKEFFPKEDTRKCVEAFDNYENNHLIDMIQPRNGAESLLIWLKQNDYRLGIVSMRERSSIMNLLRHFGFSTYFDMVLGGSSIHSDYVSSADIQLACRLMKSDNAIFIGDSASDMQAAREAGAFSIGIAVNPDKTPAIVNETPDFVTGDLSQIQKLLTGEPLWLAYRVYQPDELEKMAAKEKKKEEKKKAKKEEKKAKKEKKKKKKFSEDTPA